MTRIDADMAYMELFDPGALAKLGRLELIARQVVEGFISGRHKSPFKGFSVEFAEHREYVPGDDIGDIDWRVYGRTDRYYIKEYEEETNLRSYLLVDASGSMRYTPNGAARGRRRWGRRRDGVAGPAISKFRYAQFVAASLAYLMLRQQDAVGMVTFDTQTRRYIPPRSRANHLKVLAEELHRTECDGETSLGAIFHDLAERIRRRGLIIIISDCFDDLDSLVQGLHHFRHRKHEVIVLHTMADDEMTFPFRQWTLFRDLEIGDRRVMLDPLSVRDAYLERVSEFLRELQHRCGQLEIDYVPLNTGEPFDLALSRYLAFRAARAR